MHPLYFLSLSLSLSLSLCPPPLSLSLSLSLSLPFPTIWGGSRSHVWPRKYTPLILINNSDLSVYMTGSVTPSEFYFKCLSKYFGL